MSAGAFVRSKYESDSGEIYSIRLQEETIAATIASAPNAAPSGAVTGEPSAFARGSRRGIGVNARGIRVAFTAAPPTGYLAGQVLSVPILQKTVWDGIARLDTGTYIGAAVEVVSKYAEQIN